MASMTCTNCGRPIDFADADLACPECGGKDRTVSVHEEVQAQESWISTAVREAWEYNKFFVIAMLLVTFGSPFLGLIVAGWPGVVVGLVLSAVSLILGFIAVTRLRESTHHHHYN
jgi:hypothetical protein